MVPSRRVAGIWSAWLLLAMSLTLAASAIPFVVRSGICLLILFLGGQAIRRFVLLRGTRSLQAVEWVAPLGFMVRSGESAARLAAVPSRGCRRYGRGLWLLSFDTVSGVVSGLVDTGLQDPRALRRLSRRLGWGAAGQSGLPPAAS